MLEIIIKLYLLMAVVCFIPIVGYYLLYLYTNSEDCYIDPIEAILLIVIGATFAIIPGYNLIAMLAAINEINELKGKDDE